MSRGQALTLVPDLSITPADLAIAAFNEVPDGNTEADLLEHLVGVLAVQVQRDSLMRLNRELIRQDRNRILGKGNSTCHPNQQMSADQLSEGRGAANVL